MYELGIVRVILELEDSQPFLNEEVGVHSTVLWSPGIVRQAQGRRVAVGFAVTTPCTTGFTISLTNSHRARTHASTGMTNCEASLVNEGMALEKGAFSHMSMVINPTPD
jgi:hypothetical protein